VLVRIGGAGGLQATSVLKRVDGVLSVEPMEDGAYSVSCVQGSDNRAELARAVMEQGWDLLELGTMKMSLEEIFLKLTEGVTIEDLTGGPLAEPGVEEEEYD
jgi:ABC-2 type transport system ATP-binding protein